MNDTALHEAAHAVCTVRNGLRFDHVSVLAGKTHVFSKGWLLHDEDDKRIDAWNAGDIELLVAHPASAGHGVKIRCWFSLPWSAELYAQGEPGSRGKTSAIPSMPMCF